MNSVGKGGVRPPSWSEFLLEAAEKIAPARRKIVREIKALIKSDDYLTAAEVIRNEIKQENFTNLVKARFHTPDFKAAPIHKTLFNLDLRIAITPNFDSIYETAAGERGAGALTTKIYHDDDIADCLRRHERVLIKSHGTISSPNKLIFTRTDYAKARNANSQFYELLDALLRTHTFIFVGCGVNDPDIRSLLENYRYRHPYGQSHYFVTASKNFCQEVKNVLCESLKINFIEYQPTKDHINLSKELEILRELVELERIELSKSQSW
ncbi:SIR2 family protein [Pseudomonas chlororaphis]|uniref:SIR2 family protein n=1 Tax=Pseudomonas chlororaphis TaxID=587753 RepID=UPI0023679437|nr:SIR2 family protein [Pseudomonas chlororaphis]WDG78848.1 SIR2 family protein [Pseudomonas chlororaphis]WDG87965.1 SIR2 family protein [Pseudomonas chlororaphis]